MKQKTNLVVVLSRVPYPIDRGDKLRAYHMLLLLSNSYDIFLFCTSTEKENTTSKSHLLTFCKEVHIYYLNKLHTNLHLLKAFFTKIPFQVNYFYSKEFHKYLKNEIVRIKPKLIFFQTIRVAEYCISINHPLMIIDYVDALSTSYFKLSLYTKGLKKIFYKIESIRLKKYETFIFNKFKKHIIISESDKEDIQHYNKDKIFVIKNGVDTSSYFPIDSIKMYHLIFHGIMNYTPNEACAIYIIKNLLPKLNSEIKLLISGGFPSKKLIEYTDYKNIKVTGWVKDLRQTFSSAKVFIAPLFMGAGSPNKILEAMAMGIPCVVSVQVSSALNLEHDINVLIGNSDEEFCNHITSLLDDKKLYDKIATNALEFVKINHNWNKLIKDMINFIEV